MISYFTSPEPQPEITKLLQVTSANIDLIKSDKEELLARFNELMVHLEAKGLL